MKTIILAGGKSSRMGQNKALMTIGGHRVIDRLLSEFSNVSEEVILIANDKTPYENLPVRILEDVVFFKGEGPLAGMYSGLSAVGNGPCLIVACDMPFASAKFGKSLVKILVEHKRDAVVPIIGGTVHPLFAAYDTRVVDIVEETLLEGKRAVRALLDRIDVEFVEIEASPELVWNMNTLDDYIEAVKLAERRSCHEL